ncbi:MAG: DUF4405 domain-containing protein [Calditrichia bacterium]
MAEYKTKKFNWRAFTSLYVVFSFILMGISGLILYITPPGRVAYWTNWKLFFLTKEAWGAVHTIFSLSFIIMGSIHLYFNWKPFVSYMKSRVQAGLRVRREVAYSGLISLFILVFTLLELPPFSTIMNFGETISESWATEQEQPPAPHAELMTLAEFSQTIQIPLDVLMFRLETAGVRVEKENAIVKEVASANNMTPSELYQAIQSLPKVLPTTEMGSGMGYGKLKVADISRKLNITPEQTMQILKANGIDVTVDATLRDLATAHRMLPIEIVNLLEKQKSQAQLN